MSKANPNMPRKVAMLGSLPPLRALSSYCLALTQAMADLCRVEFLSFKKIYPAFLYPGGDLCDDETFPPINHPSLEVRRRLTWYNPISWVMEGLEGEGEVLHAQWWTSFLGPVYFVVFVGFKLRKKPIVITVHNVLSHDRRMFDEIISRVLFKLCDHFIVHSSSNEAQLKKYFQIPDDRISNIPHGPLDFHVQAGKDRDNIRKAFGYKPEDKVILLFGAIRPYKGIDTALEAFQKLITEIPDARLLIAGKLWEPWDRYEKTIRELNISAYVKTHLAYIPSDEVNNYFLVSDIVLLPYHHFDAQSGIGATALAFEKPMIVSDTGGLPEFVGDPFYVVPPKDAEALTQKLIICLNDPVLLANMSKDSKMIADRISWKAIAAKTLSVYQNVIEKKNSAKK